MPALCVFKNKIEVRLCDPLESPSAHAANSQPATAAATNAATKDAVSALVLRCVGLVGAGCEGLALHGRRPHERAASSLARWDEASDDALEETNTSARVFRLSLESRACKDCRFVCTTSPAVTPPLQLSVQSFQVASRNQFSIMFCFTLLCFIFYFFAWPCL